MGKLADAWNLFRKGEVVANPAAWKQGQMSVNAVGAVILAGSQMLGDYNVHLPISQDAAMAIAGGIVAIFNIVFTIVTSDKVGLSPKPVSNSQEESPVASTNVGGVESADAEDVNPAGQRHRT